MSPTARGVALALAAPVLLLVGALGGYPDLAILGAAALAALLAAAVTLAGRPRLDVARQIDPPRVTRGEACAARVRVTNRRREGPVARAGALTAIAVDRCGSDEIAVPILRVRPGETSTAEYAVPTERRGVVVIGPLRISRTDPLGAFRQTSVHGDTTRVLVYPRAYPLVAVPTGITRSLDGHSDAVLSGTITFDRLRPYVRGDELRHVHWRTSARLGELMVREHVEESLPHLLVVVDDRADPYPEMDAFEEVCDAAASLLALASRDDLPIRLVLVSEVGGPGSGVSETGGAPARMAPALDRLAAAALTPAGRDSMARIAAHLRRHDGSDTLIFLTGIGTPADTATIGGLGSRYPVSVIAEFGPADHRERPVTGGDLRSGTAHHLRPDGAAAFAIAWDTIGRR